MDKYLWDQTQEEILKGHLNGLFLGCLFLKRHPSSAEVQCNVVTSITGFQ